MEVHYNECENFGTKVLCENELSSEETVPQWLDRDMISRAKTLFKKHIFGIIFAHFSGLILLVYIKSILKPLLSTGNSRSVSHLFGRYFRTLVAVKGWYEGDVFDTQHPSHHSIIKVRQMHKSVSNKLNKDKKEGVDELSVSQFDMFVTQFAFIGFVVLFPRQMGFSQSEEDLEAILHFWKGIGYLLGIEDKYNLCNGSVHQIKSRCAMILEQKLKKSIESPQREAIEMSKAIVKAFKFIAPLLSYDGLIKYLFELIDIKRENRLNLFSKFSYHLTRITFNFLLHSPFCAVIINNMFRLYLIIIDWKKQSIEKRLSKKYDLVFEQTIQTNSCIVDVISV